MPTMHLKAFVAATLIAGLLSLPTAAAAESVTWKMQSPYQAGSLNQQIFERFAENVRIASGGRLTIEALPVETIVPAAEVIDAVRDGVLDGQHANWAYIAGKEAAVGMLADPITAYEHPVQQLMWFDYGGGRELAQELFDRWNQHWLGPTTWGMESIPTKKPVRSIEDFEGLRIRAPEGQVADLFRRLGAGVSVLPGTEVYTALETGKLDATDWGTLAMNDDLGYDRIAEYAIYPGIHSGASHGVTIRKDRWEALEPDLQKIVELAVRELGRELYYANQIGDIRAAAQRDGKTLITWTPEERRRLREVAREVWLDWSKKSPLATKVYESHIAWMEQLGLID